MRARQLLVALVTCAGGGCSGGAAGEDVAQVGSGAHALEAPVGLSLRFVNGQAAPLTLFGSAERYLQEIDVSESVTSFSDEGIDPLIENSVFSALDWSGIAAVEEIWVP